MARLDGSDQTRLALLGLLAGVLGVTAATAPPLPAVPPTKPGPRGLAGPGPRESSDPHAALIGHLERLGKTEPTPAQWGQVSAAIDHSSWRVARRAFHVLNAHEHPQRQAAAIRLLARAIDYERTGAERPGEAQRSSYETFARQLLIADVAEFMTPPTADQPAAVLRAAMRFAPQGSVRARALRLLAPSESRDDRSRLVAAALRDSSELVLIAALDIIAAHGHDEAPDRIHLLAASPRPMVRGRAAQVLRRLGRSAAPGDYSAAVIDAVNELASRLVEAGLEFRDVLPWAANASNESQHEAIVQAAETYLDAAAGSAAPSDDGHGVLLLVAAARSRHDRLTIRLWEHEIRLADSDGEMLSRGLQALARARLISGLMAYRQGDRSAALDDLAALAGLTRAQIAADVRLQIYVANAAAVSAAIWNGTTNQVESIVAAGLDDSDEAGRLATTVLGSLDHADPAQRTEAHRRIDSWCGIRVDRQPDEFRRGRMAN